MMNTILMTFDDEPPSSTGLFTSDIAPAESPCFFLSCSGVKHIQLLLEEQQLQQFTVVGSKIVLSVEAGTIKALRK